MPNTKLYDSIVIGCGEAGKYLAWHLARNGQSVLVVERSMVGGSCPNIACLPSKNVIYSAKVLNLVRNARRYGADIASWSINGDTVRQRKEAMVDGLVQMHFDKFAQSGAELLMGEAQFTGDRRINVTLPNGATNEFEGKQIFLNTGSRAAMPDIPGLLASRPMTHVQALELETLPKHLLVLGGGFVGIELAQAFQRLGCAVTLVHKSSRLLDQEDPEVSTALLALLESEGIDVCLSTTVEQVTGASGDAVQATIRRDNENSTLNVSHILVATGRLPNTERLDLHAGNVEVTSKGFVKVDEYLRTTAEGVWAMGDCAGSPMYTHVSYDDFRVVRDTIAGKHRSTQGRLVPFTLYTDPEFARVGLNESEAASKGLAYRVAKLPMAAVLRTRTMGETRGFLKALIADDDTILGFTALGVGAGELAAAVQLVMLAKKPYTLVADAIIAHPTLTEGLMYLFASVPSRGVSA